VRPVELAPLTVSYSISAVVGSSVGSTVGVGGGAEKQRLLHIIMDTRRVRREENRAVKMKVRADDRTPVTTQEQLSPVEIAFMTWCMSMHVTSV